MSELNNLESRKGRKPLDVNNVVYWFKNARAAQKRAEVRGTNSGQYTYILNNISIVIKIYFGWANHLFSTKIGDHSTPTFLIALYTLLNDLKIILVVRTHISVFYPILNCINKCLGNKYCS